MNRKNSLQKNRLAFCGPHRPNAKPRPREDVELDGNPRHSLPDQSSAGGRTQLLLPLRSSNPIQSARPRFADIEIP
jgi:hypothetical protein